jgi:hypothetical protein
MSSPRDRRSPHTYSDTACPDEPTTSESCAPAVRPASRASPSSVAPTPRRVVPLQASSSQAGRHGSFMPSLSVSAPRPGAVDPFCRGVRALYRISITSRAVQFQGFTSPSMPSNARTFVLCCENSSFFDCARIKLLPSTRHTRIPNTLTRVSAPGCN